MNIYLPHPEQGNDYQRIRRNGMWYQHWQAGYSDILKKGYPQPKSQETIIAELYSPKIDDFLHGILGEVPFLISERALEVFKESGITGFRISSVEVAKIATKGIKKGRDSEGEPEDAIFSRRDVKKEVFVPTLYAVYITGHVQAIPDFPSGCSPSGNISPFAIKLNSSEVPDLFQPEVDGKSFSNWSFCSERFKTIVEKARLTNITF
jgi:hypothetical protein